MRISAPIAIVPVSIIGLGNVFLGDDGFGPLAIETFRCEYAVESVAVEVLDLGTPGLDLAPYLYGRELVIVVDAVHADLPAGILSVFSEDDFAGQRAKLRITGHDPGLWESLVHLRLAGEAPHELIVLGVSPESCGFAEQISPKLLSIASAAAATIARLLVERGFSCNLRNEAASLNLWWLPVVQIKDAAAA
jgi:hydrogenase maturation protease